MPFSFFVQQDVCDYLDFQASTYLSIVLCFICIVEFLLG
jgi:hypothetical protein